MFQIFVPALMYCSVLEGLNAAIIEFSPETLVEVVFPPIWCILVLSVGFLVAYVTTLPFRLGKEVATQRTILVAAAIGNSGDMPLLILTTLCDNFPQLRSTHRCISRSAQLTSLYATVWNMVIVRVTISVSAFCI